MPLKNEDLRIAEEALQKAEDEFLEKSFELYKAGFESRKDHPKPSPETLKMIERTLTLLEKWSVTYGEDLKTIKGWIKAGFFLLVLLIILLLSK